MITGCGSHDRFEGSDRATRFPRAQEDAVLRLSGLLSGLTYGFVVATAVSFLDPRTPWWGHVIFALPAVPTGLAAAAAGRRHLRPRPLPKE
jgi:hypothetical protein